MGAEGFHGDSNPVSGNLDDWKPMISVVLGRHFRRKPPIERKLRWGSCSLPCLCRLTDTSLALIQGWINPWAPAATLSSALEVTRR